MGCFIPPTKSIWHGSIAIARGSVDKCTNTSEYFNIRCVIPASTSQATVSEHDFFAIANRAEAKRMTIGKGTTTMTVPKHQLPPIMLQMVCPPSAYHLPRLVQTPVLPLRHLVLLSSPHHWNSVTPHVSAKHLVDPPFRQLANRWDVR